jgi:hypothetical protein
MLRREIKIQPDDDPGLVRHRLGPSKLYIDDIALICDTLREASESRAKATDTEAAPVVITAGEAMADSAEDLRDATPSELRSVRIALDRPLVSVDLWARSADVSAQSSDVDGKALALGIRDFVKSKRSWRGINVFVNGREVLPIAFLPIACLVYHVVGLGWVAAIAVTICLFLAGILVSVISIYRSGSTLIIPRKQSEVRGLSAENRRQLLIGLTGAIVGALIAGIAGLWAGGAIHH